MYLVRPWSITDRQVRSTVAGASASVRIWRGVSGKGGGDVGGRAGGEPGAPIVPRRASSTLPSVVGAKWGGGIAAASRISGVTCSNVAVCVLDRACEVACFLFIDTGRAFHA